MKHWGLTNISASESISLMWLKEPRMALGFLGGLVIFFTGILVYYSAKIWNTDYFPLKSMLLMITGESLIFIIFGVLARNGIMT